MLKHIVHICYLISRQTVFMFAHFHTDVNERTFRGWFIHEFCAQFFKYMYF